MLVLALSMLAQAGWQLLFEHNIIEETCSRPTAILFACMSSQQRGGHDRDSHSPVQVPHCSSPHHLRLCHVQRLVEHFESLSLGGGPGMEMVDTSLFPRPVGADKDKAVAPQPPYDQGNCSPANMRPTVNALPNSTALRARCVCSRAGATACWQCDVLWHAIIRAYCVPGAYCLPALTCMHHKYPALVANCTLQAQCPPCFSHFAILDAPGIHAAAPATLQHWLTAAAVPLTPFYQILLHGILLLLCCCYRWQLPLGVIVRPMADDALGIQVPVIPLGPQGIVRCRRCRTYMNPFIEWTDGGRRFKCNVCAMLNEAPVEYFSTLDHNGRRRDAEERPELSRGTTEWIAPTEYMVSRINCYVAVYGSWRWALVWLFYICCMSGGKGEMQTGLVHC